MPNNALLPVMGCVLVLSAVGADYGLGQMAVPKPRRLPVETFPAVIGAWKAGPVQPVQEDVQQKLRTAKIVDRTYTSPDGQSVDLMLLTATENEDMHSPQLCFPNQGWTLSDIHETRVDGQTATQMRATLGDQRQTVLYWLTGYYPPAPPKSAALRDAYFIRNRIMKGRTNMSLFVRIIVADTPAGRRSLPGFTSALRAPLTALVGADGTRRPSAELRKFYF